MPVNFDTAHSLEEAFVYATEVNLATLCDLCMTKKVAKSKVARQRSICMGMLKTCRRQWVTTGNVNWGESRHRNFPRVSELISNREPEGILGALDRLIQSWSGQDSAVAILPAAQTA